MPWSADIAAAFFYVCVEYAVEMLICDSGILSLHFSSMLFRWYAGGEGGRHYFEQIRASSR